ncbi:MAG: helix-turn-helix transcriptional regulator [Tepidisphaera sp.]
MTTVSDQLRQAIKASPLSRNQLAEQSGVPASGISRFMAGTELRTGNVDRLCVVLGLKLTHTGKAGKDR